MQTKRKVTRAAEEEALKVRALAEFYSEDLSKTDDVVDEFVTFRTMYRELSMEKHELNTHSILPFLIENNMGRAFPNLAILYRIYLTIPISSAKEVRPFSRLKLKEFLAIKHGRGAAVQLSAAVHREGHRD